MLVSVQVSDPPLPRAPDARYKQRLAGLTVPNCRTRCNQGIKGRLGFLPCPAPLHCSGQLGPLHVAGTRLDSGIARPIICCVDDPLWADRGTPPTSEVGATALRSLGSVIGPRPRTRAPENTGRTICPGPTQHSIPLARLKCLRTGHRAMLALRAPLLRAPPCGSDLPDRVRFVLTQRALDWPAA